MFNLLLPNLIVKKKIEIQEIDKVKISAGNEGLIFYSNNSSNVFLTRNCEEIILIFKFLHSKLKKMDLLSILPANKVKSTRSSIKQNGEEKLNI